MGAKGESMKKFLALLLSLVLCCSFGLLAACDDSANDDPANDGTGTISGNYTEATDDDYKTFMAAVSDEEKLFPGFDEEFGISADANADISATIGSGDEAQNVSLKLSELSMALSVKSGTAGAEEDVAMKVSVDASANIPQIPDLEVPAFNGAVKGNIYADETNFYIDATVGEEVYKHKISGDMIGDLLDGIFGGSSSKPGVMSVMSAEAEDSAQTPAISDEDVNEFKATLAEMGVKFEVDMSKGIKARFTASAKTIEMLVLKIMGAPEGTELPVEFTKADIVLTLEISEDGALVAGAVSADVALSMEANAQSGIPAVEATAKLNATVKFGAVTVDLPDDLADYEDLIDDVPSTPDQGQQSPSDQPGDVSQAA